MSSTGVIVEPVAEALDQIRAGLDAFQAAPLARHDAAGQVDAALELESLRRRLDFLSLGLVQEMQISGAAKLMGAPTTSALLRYRMRLSASEANARVKAAKALCESHSITGGPIPAPLSVVSRAAAAGAIGQSHVGAILQTMDDLPDDADPGLRNFVEETLVDYARRSDPVDVKRFGHDLALRLNPKDPDPEKNAARRGLAFHDDLPGLVAFSGRCTAQAAATIQAALDPLAKPRPEVDGIKDLRTHPQRMIDALEEVSGQALRRGDLPSQGGERPHVSIGLTPERAEAGVVQLPWVGPVALNSADWMLCDTVVTFIEVNENGVPIRMSKPQRTIPGLLRRSVFERDKGCTFPGCDRPTGWSDIHHVVPWEINHDHQIDNLVTLCGFHHRLVHQQKWDITFIDRIPHSAHRHGSTPTRFHGATTSTTLPATGCCEPDLSRWTESAGADHLPLAS